MFKKLFYNLVKRYRHSTVPGWIMLFLDIALFIGAFALSELFTWRFEGHFTRNSLWINLAICTCVTFAFFYVFKTYRSIIRHMGLNDIFRVLVACVFMALTCGVLNFVNNRFLIVPTKTNVIPSYRMVILLYSMLALFMLLGRFTILYIYNQYFIDMLYGNIGIEEGAAKLSAEWRSQGGEELLAELNATYAATK